MNKQEYITKRDELFERWKSERPDYQDDTDKTFLYDGIVDAKQNFDNWQKQNPKILFLLKEVPEEREHGDQPINFSNNFSKNIARWRYLLIELFINSNNKIEYEESPDLSKLNDIAIVEIKKFNGKSRSDNKEIMAYAINDRKFLKEEIELINPHILYAVEQLTLMGMEFMEMKFGIKYLICLKTIDLDVINLAID